MITTNYRNAYKEVYTILSYLSDEEFNKIPLKVINAIKNNMNEEYEYEMNEEVDIFNQPMSIEAKCTLYNIFRDYLATPEQKEKIIKMQAEDRLRIEKEKRKKYNPDDIFKKPNNTIESTNSNALESSTSTPLIEYKEAFFVKFKNFIFKILHINN